MSRLPDPSGRPFPRLLAAVLLVALVAGLAAPAWAQQPPPPRPKEEDPKPQAPAPRPKQVFEGAAKPPPPVLVASSDMNCLLELDGEPLGALAAHVVQEFRVTPGEHLLQAFPLEVQGPVWKDTLKAPETGQVVVTIELKEIVDEWREEMENADRFTVTDATVTDHESGLVWTRNVSPEMRWDDVQTYCAGRRVDGAGGWRLPTLDELSKLYWPDHPAPRQETSRDPGQWTILGKRPGEMHVLPRLIFEPFDHNSVGALWVRGSEDRIACSFLGEFNCSLERKKAQAAAFCVRPGEP